MFSVTALSSEIREWENILSSATLASAVLFFLGLFIAMYAHIKQLFGIAPRELPQEWTKGSAAAHSFLIRGDTSTECH
ncbi:unnamed protein product [Anisakis simplex]|uniref:Small integral membrane protein 33 n=1 Tax=Anisakis simplex TaxID=6269 RepID=A0A0M3J850_ANISI|nr:unnamed protein product [Anisakis simplex]